MEKNYIAKDGLARLDLQDRRQPFSSVAKATVNNQNGIMFLAEFIVELQEQGADIGKYRKQVRETIERLRVPYTWTFNRRQDDKSLMDSHDNMLGCILLSQLFGFNDIIKGIISWGLLNSWVYNNLTDGFDVRALRKPMDIAIYLMAAGKRPYPLYLLHLWGSTFFGDMRLMRLRIASIERSPQTWATYISLLIYRWRWRARGGWPQFKQVVQNYYKDSGNPYRMMIELR